MIDQPSQAIRRPTVRPVRAFSSRIVAAAVTILFGMATASAAWPSDLIGIPTIVVTEEPDTLLDIAHDYDVGYVEMRSANPGVDPWLPGAGKEITVPTQHILPAAPRRGIVINLPELRLYYFPSDRSEPRSFPIGIGGEGKETPVGHTQIDHKKVHPIWIPTRSEHEEEPDLPAEIGPGPDDPMGEYALYLGWTGYAIHGTNRVFSIGRRDSHGCIRLYPEDILTLFNLVKPGTPVTVVDQQAKVGWSAGELYLEVHPSQDDVDAIETEGAPISSGAVDADDLVAEAAGPRFEELDWQAIHAAEARRDGIPVQVTKSMGGL